jgi:hypothetical protein
MCPPPQAMIGTKLDQVGVLDAVVAGATTRMTRHRLVAFDKILCNSDMHQAKLNVKYHV